MPEPRPPDTAERFRQELAHGNAWHALDMALAAARDAGRKVLSDQRHRTVTEQFALALQAADEALEAIGVALAEGGAAGAGEELTP
jgi:hypothetical protein